MIPSVLDIACVFGLGIVTGIGIIWIRRIIRNDPHDDGVY